jgi:hypothetical protein
MQTFSVYGCIAQFERLLGAPLGQCELQATFNQRSHRRPLASGYLFRLLQ